MWDAKVQAIGGGRGAGGARYVVARSGRAVSFAEAVAAWCGDGGFRGWFSDVLASSSFEAFRWETPGVTAATAGERGFEFVLLDAPSFVRRATDERSFARQFAEAKDGATVVEFANLGGDAIMVVPCPTKGTAAATYGHLGAFVRGAPRAQRDEMWRRVGEAMRRRMSAKPVWLSTAGGGVAWLHVRLDDAPKYYGHGPYRAGA